MRTLKVIVGENVKRYRIEQGMTQVDLYRKIHGGTVGSFVRELERGERNMPEPIDLISQSVGMTSFGLYKKEKAALNNLDVVEQFEVLKVFAEWGIKEEQPPC